MQMAMQNWLMTIQTYPFKIGDCHVRAHSEELKKLPHWVCWKAEQGENGKLRKVPINPITGGGAMSNTPSTWTDFETAVKASEQYSGVGFMFAPPYLA